MATQYYMLAFAPNEWHNKHLDSVTLRLPVRRFTVKDRIHRTQDYPRYKFVYVDSGPTKLHILEKTNYTHVASLSVVPHARYTLAQDSVRVWRPGKDTTEYNLLTQQRSMIFPDEGGVQRDSDTSPFYMTLRDNRRTVFDRLGRYNNPTTITLTHPNTSAVLEHDFLIVSYDGLSGSCIDFVHIGDSGQTTSTIPFDETIVVRTCDQLVFVFSEDIQAIRVYKIAKHGEQFFTYTNCKGCNETTKADKPIYIGMIECDELGFDFTHEIIPPILKGEGGSLWLLDEDGLLNKLCDAMAL